MVGVAGVGHFIGIAAALIVTFDVAAQPIRFGMFPASDPEKLAAAMAVLAEHLAGETGDEVTAVVTRDYGEVAERLKAGSLDLAWVNTFNYVRIGRDLPGIKYLATYVERDEESGAVLPTYRAYVVAMKERGITGLADLRGRTFAFTDAGSASGFAYPARMLRQSGLDPERDFAKAFFLKKHDRVVEALRAGSVDAGAISDGTYRTAVRHYGDRFAVIATSEPIPLDAIVAGPALPEDRAEAYRLALTAMPREHRFFAAMRAIGWSAAGFEVMPDSFYDDARRTLEP